MWKIMEKRIKEIIKNEFDAEVFEIKKLEGKFSFSHNNFDVLIGWPMRNVIMRFARNKGDEVGLAKENYVIELLRKNNIPAPKVLAFNNDEKNEDNSYMILQKLPGTPLNNLWDNLTKDEKIKITEKIGALLKKIHNIKLDEFGIITDGKIKSEPEFSFKQTGKGLPYSKFLREFHLDALKNLARMLSHKNLSPDYISKFMTFITKNQDVIDYQGPPVLNHGDFVHGHIFVQETNQGLEICGLIDFEFARASSPEYDFLKLHRIGFFDDSEIKEALIKGYGEINEKAVEIHRIIRDFGFAQVLLQSGDTELAQKTLKDIESKIN
jgi:aminoglycoside phosphotransferase (APT) family kinase protein